MEGESCYYHCVLCNYSTKAKLNLIQHVRSMKHQRSESLRKLQRLQKGLPEEDEDLGQIFTIRRCPSTDPGETRQCTGRGGGEAPWCASERAPPAWLLPVSGVGASAYRCVLGGRRTDRCLFLKDCLSLGLCSTTGKLQTSCPAAGPWQAFHTNP